MFGNPNERVPDNGETTVIATGVESLGLDVALKMKFLCPYISKTYQLYVRLTQPEREGDFSWLSGVVNNMWVYILYVAYAPLLRVST